MTVYSVYEPPLDQPDLASRAEGLLFVKEGFSWGALFVPGIWLIYRGMWIELIAFVLLFALLTWLLGGSDMGQAVFGWTALAVIVLFAVEANDLRGASLERRGFRVAGIASGPDRDSAELSFYRSWLPQQEREGLRHPVPVRGTPERRKPATAAMAADEGEEVIGFFPRP